MKKNIKTDIQIDTETEWFRTRSCGIIIEINSILVITNEAVDYFYSVGGGVQIGETTEEACIREVFEETGFHYEIDRLAFIHENFFKKNNILHHEIAFYYLMKPKGNQNIYSNSFSMNGVKEKLAWIQMDEYNKFNIHPTFLVDELKKLGNEVKHIITKGF